MNGKEIYSLIGRDPVLKTQFLGVFAADELPSYMPVGKGLIVNCCNRDLPGQHWLAIYQSTTKKVEFFDSFGRDPRDTSFPDNYKNIVEKFNDLEYSKVQIQSFNSVTCGYFCIHFIYVLSLGLDLEFFLNEYSNNFMKNDEFVVDFVNSL